MNKRSTTHTSTILRIVALTALSLCMLAFVGCGGDASMPGSADNGKLRVVTTTVQITALTHEVGGDLIDLSGLVPAGADAHEFEPVASDLAAVEDAQLILRHGIGLDDWLDDTLDAASNATVVTISDGIALEAPELERAAKDDEAHADVDGADPHVWHDPDRAKRMVANIAAALAHADPDHAPTYEASAAAYAQTLDDTKSEVQSIIDEIPEANRKLVTNHDAFGYFTRAFGLETVGAVIPSTTTDAEASAQDTAALLETIDREGVRAIFAETSANTALAETLANDAGVRIIDDLYGDSLGEPGTEAATVHGMLLANARTIADALK